MARQSWSHGLAFLRLTSARICVLSHEPGFERRALSLIHGGYREVDARGSIPIGLSRPSYFSNSVFGNFFVPKPQVVLRFVGDPMFHLHPGSSDLGLVASNAFRHFFKLAAYLGLRAAGLFSNRDFQKLKLFVDVDEFETNLSTECIDMRTHGEPFSWHTSDVAGIVMPR
jgi:hypothetical protein